ncbi:MAG: alpha/beta hydrolase [Myxococcales bacterium]|nr:alpha/beta hydrolase [Myxococcales bacterium]
MRPVIALIPLLSLACSDPNREPLTEGELSWEPCALQVDDKGPTTQCTTAQMPLWWDEPDADQIELFAQRHLSKAGDQVLWLLPGGPGQTGAVLEGYLKTLSKELVDTDIYLFEHRGVGRSTRLSCPDQEDPASDGGIDVTTEEWPDCLAAAEAEWGEDLAAFSSANAADDLAEWIRLTAQGRPAFVYGGSYGTTLSHRFLQRHPDLVEGVILDSLALDVDHRVYDIEFDAVARGVLTLCGDDERCAEALGDDPEAKALEAMASVTAGECDAIDATTLRRGAAAFTNDATLRGFAPALFARALRCTEDDAMDIERLIGLFEDREPHYTETLYSPILFSNIELSEQWPEPWPTLEELQAIEATTLFSFGLGPMQRPLLDIWPRYPFDHDTDNALAQTDTPILMMHGDLDPLTPTSRTEDARAHFDGPGQHFVSFPQGTHILLGSTPSRRGDCATQLLMDFLADPLAEPDASCVEDVDPVDFDGQPVTSWLLLSDCSRYGNGCGGRRSTLLLLPLLGWMLRRRHTSPTRDV